MRSPFKESGAYSVIRLLKCGKRPATSPVRDAQVPQRAAVAINAPASIMIGAGCFIPIGTPLRLSR